MRAAIIGLYNSGSSVLSQIVEALGAEIGHPLWDNHFESLRLKEELRRWWRPPLLLESAPRNERVDYLRRWAEELEGNGAHAVCAKHPMLCLSAADLDEAWGDDYKAIRAARPLEKSIERLVRRRWFDGTAATAERLQRALWDASEEYFARKEHLAVDHEELRAEPLAKVREIADYLELECEENVLRAAAAVVCTG